MSYKLNLKDPIRKSNLALRRVRQRSYTATVPYLHPGKYNGEDLRKIRQKNGVGGPPAKCNWAQAGQMNRLHTEIMQKRKERHEVQ